MAIGLHKRKTIGLFYGGKAGQYGLFLRVCIHSICLEGRCPEYAL